MNKTENKTINNSRRDFLSKATIAGSVTLAPGVLLHQTANAADADVDTVNMNTSVSTRPLDQDVSSK
ncbi:MAG: twin-arginine translocation signal domain-containing protein, partial [Gammaproteobacteria bacterium]